MGIRIYCLGKKALLALEKLNTVFDSSIDLIVIGTDNNIKEDYSRQIENIAIKRGLEFCYRNEIGNKKNKSRYHITLGWRWLVEVEPFQQLIVFHDSLLPKYRGFNPLVTQLINGDDKIGATCFFATADYDEGSIILQKSITVEYPIKINEAINKIASVYAELLGLLVDSIHSGKIIEGQAQDASEATYSLWRNEDDYLIDWTKSAAYVKRFVDAVGEPYNGAFFYFKNKKIRVVDVHVIDDVVIVNRDAGKIFKKHNNNPIVVCGTGLIEIKKMVDENGNEFNLDLFRVKL
jgi:methionyl-tRNA formyltransferase